MNESYCFGGQKTWESDKQYIPSNEKKNAHVYTQFDINSPKFIHVLRSLRLGRWARTKMSLRQLSKGLEQYKLQEGARCMNRATAAKIFVSGTLIHSRQFRASWPAPFRNKKEIHTRSADWRGESSFGMVWARDHLRSCQKTVLNNEGRFVCLPPVWVAGCGGKQGHQSLFTNTWGKG